MVDGKGPFDFMVDSGLTAELITPHLRQTLNLKGSGQKLSTGLAAGGSVNGGELVQLRGVTLPRREGGGDGNSLALPPLTAVVTGFVQEHLDPAHDPVEGMLGMVGGPTAMMAARMCVCDELQGDKWCVIRAGVHELVCSCGG